MTTTTEPQTTVSAGAPRRRGLLVAGVVAAVVAALYVVLALVSGDGVPRGTTVAGVDVGGQSQTEAAATLDSALAKQMKAPIVATVGDTKVAVVPAAAGLALDAPATVAQVAGRTWNPIALLQRLGGGQALDPVITVDDAKLAAQVSSIASDTDVEATEPTIAVQGTKVTST